MSGLRLRFRNPAVSIFDHIAAVIFFLADSLNSRNAFYLLHDLLRHQHPANLETQRFLIQFCVLFHIRQYQVVCTAFVEINHVAAGRHYELHSAICSLAGNFRAQRRQGRFLLIPERLQLNCDVRLVFRRLGSF